MNHSNHIELVKMSGNLWQNMYAKHYKFLPIFRLAAADQAARARDKASEDPDGAGGVGSSAMGKRRPGGLEPGQAGPSSLFILSENNVIRKTTKFLIEWPYPNLRKPAQYIINARYVQTTRFSFFIYEFSIFSSEAFYILVSFVNFCVFFSLTYLLLFSPNLLII